MTDLDKVQKKIDKRKSSDPEGLYRSIFHINCIESNLMQLVLDMANYLSAIRD